MKVKERETEGHRETDRQTEKDRDKQRQTGRDTVRDRESEGERPRGPARMLTPGVHAVWRLDR